MDFYSVLLQFLRHLLAACYMERTLSQCMSLCPEEAYDLRRKRGPVEDTHIARYEKRQIVINALMELSRA